jgi:hypothetical protein
VFLSLLITSFLSAFVPLALTEKFGRTAVSALKSSSRPDSFGEVKNARRSLVQIVATSLSVSLMLSVSPASAAGKSFTPGGTLVDYEIGVAVGNPEASKS